MSDVNERLRALPQVHQLLRDTPELEASLGPLVARWVVRREVEAARARALAGADPGDIRAHVRAASAELRSRAVSRVINATGVVLHTNLGRAPLSEAARDAVVEASGPVALEYDVSTGRRASRAPVAARLAAALCDAEDAVVVNNGAAALLLMLAALAAGREVIVSRGELIEIGGEFRLPELMASSGARMREVGTTNRTHLRDYRDGLSRETACILKVHPSNYEIVGFTASPSVEELAELAREAGVPLLYDLGSGLLGPVEGTLAGEPDARGAIAAGAELVCFSGDKLLGGPQAGIVAGNVALVERCRRHPLARALRPDKLALAALEHTLWAHALGRRAQLPVWRMLEASEQELRERAEAFARDTPGARTIAGESVTGGGSMPGGHLPTTLVAIDHPHPERLASALRRHDPPVIARVEGGAVVLDLRTVHPADTDTLAEAVRAALAL